MKHLLLLGVIAAVSAGCGGNTSNDGAGGAGGDTAGSGGGAQNDASAGGAGGSGGAAGSSTDASVADAPVESGWPGGETYSLTIGPIHVDKGVEKTQCVVLKLPNTHTIHVGQFHDVITASHHMIVYRTNDTQEQTTPFDCTPFVSTLNPAKGAPLAITQKADDVIDLPKGVAYTFDTNQFFRLELHYINASSTPDDVQGTATFTTIGDADYQNEAEMLFIGNPDIHVAAHATATLGPSFLKLPTDIGTPNFFAITGHEHHLGTNVTIATADSAKTDVTSVYDVPNWSWSDPATVKFDPPFQVPAGGGFNFTCDWNNTTDKSVGFGESVNNEMCFFWAYYYPSQGARVCVVSQQGGGILANGACCPGSPLCSLISGYLGN